MKDKIIISKCTHPLPTPEFDYCAYWDGWETGNQGWGSSPDLACADLLANYELPEEDGKPITEWEVQVYE